MYWFTACVGASANETKQAAFENSVTIPPAAGPVKEEKALGFPKNSLATHTEARAATQVPLEPGDHMIIDGQYPPCPSCKGKMNARAGQTGATIQYNWTENGQQKTWVANPPKGCK